jgi:L-lactate utilization protein LutB
VGTIADRYWEHRLEACRAALEANRFEAFVAQDADEARELVLGRILPGLGASTVSWGDSLTLYATGVLDVLRKDPGFRVIETFDDTVPRAEVIERRRQALLADLFLTGANAVTETGALVNLDMVGNRVAALTFGPRWVVVVAGRNKIVPDVEAAMARVKGFAAPANAMRHTRFRTPCAETSYCADCRSPDRICNTWTITEKSFPPGRTKVVLIARDLGL